MGRINNRMRLISLLGVIAITMGGFLSCGMQQNGKYSFTSGEFGEAYYYIDTEGNLASENCFIIPEDFNDDGFAYVNAFIETKEGTKRVRGFIDNSFDFIGGKYTEAGKPYDYASESVNGVLLQTIEEDGGKLLLMDASTQKIAEVNDVDIYDSLILGPSDNGYFLVKTNDGKYGYVDKNGNWMIKPKFSMACEFIKGCALVKYKGKCGLIDEQGNWVIEPKYYYMCYGGDCTYFRADIEDDDAAFIYIDKDENPLNDKQYSGLESADYFEEGLCYIYDEETGLYGYLDETGEYAIEPQFTDAYSFRNGQASVSKEIDGQEKWGCITTKGELVIDCIYDDVVFFEEGYAAVNVDGLWGYIKEDGSWFIEPRYEEAYNFHDGYAAVKVDGLWGYIKEDGNWFLEPQFEEVKSFSNGYAAVKMKDGQKIKK